MGEKVLAGVTVNHINILNFIGYRFIDLAARLDTVSSYPKKEAERYRREDPFETKAISFPLTETSRVVDVGGYTGDWAERIYGRYSCNVDIYEPHPQLAEQARLNFFGNRKVVVFRYGLGGTTRMEALFGDSVRASIVRNNLAGWNHVQIVKGSDIFNERYGHIDLLKINIEGSEYELLPDLIKDYDMHKIDHILVQFHRNVPDYEQKRDIIRYGLSRSHNRVWNYDYIFEYWKVM